MSSNSKYGTCAFSQNFTEAYQTAMPLNSFPIKQLLSNSYSNRQKSHQTGMPLNSYAIKQKLSNRYSNKQNSHQTVIPSNSYTIKQLLHQTAMSSNSSHQTAVIKQEIHAIKQFGNHQTDRSIKQLLELHQTDLESSNRSPPN